MKNIFWLATIVLLTGLLAAQNQPQTQTPPPSDQKDNVQVYGRGRGGIPFAWNDTNKDGICDLTGEAVMPAGSAGQVGPIGLGRGVATGRGVGWGRGGGWGRGAGWGRGRGFAAGRGRGRFWGGPVNTQAPAQVTPAQPKQ